MELQQLREIRSPKQLGDELRKHFNRYSLTLRNITMFRAQLKSSPPLPQPSTGPDEDQLRNFVTEANFQKCLGADKAKWQDFVEKSISVLEAKKEQVLTKEKSILNDIVVSYIHNW